jgi:hypothetical protein
MGQSLCLPETIPKAGFSITPLLGTDSAKLFSSHATSKNRKVDIPLGNKKIELSITKGQGQDDEFWNIRASLQGTIPTREKTFVIAGKTVFMAVESTSGCDESRTLTFEIVNSGTTTDPSIEIAWAILSE